MRKKTKNFTAKDTKSAKSKDTTAIPCLIQKIFILKGFCLSSRSLASFAVKNVVDISENSCPFVVAKYKLQTTKGTTNEHEWTRIITHS